jgi:hypothetical protein
MEQFALWKPVDLEKRPNAYSQDDIAKAMGFITKAGPADSGLVAPLIRQDLDPKIYDVFVKKFPFWDMVEKIPANGLVHAYNQKTAYGAALFQAETGTVTDDASTYNRATANIAVLATRRGVSLKAQYAVRQGGAPYDAEAEEIEGGLVAMAYTAQRAIFRYQNTNSGATTPTAADGNYDANAFDGLRYVLNNQSPAANTVTVATGTGTNPTPVTGAVKQAVDAIIDAGGNPSLIVGASQGARLLEFEQMQFARYMLPGSEIVPGLRVKEVDAGYATLPLLRVPGDSVGTYVAGGHTYSDLFILDMDVVKWAYLGGATPTVLEIPIGVDSKLQKLFIPFMMGGLVVTVPAFIARVSVQIA